jgi:CheY-like chemotaxis protein
VDLGALMRSTIDSVTMPSVPCQIATSIPSESLFADVDPLRIGQVITNLIANACRYSKKDGLVSVGLARAGDEAVIVVRDNGAGIPPELLSKIFEMFVQLDSPAPDRQWSMGVGLALARSLVELHRGRIEARSGGADTGSEFRIYLPMAVDGAPSETVSAAPSKDESNIRGVRALVVDDHRDAADMMATLLELGGHQVQVAYDGRDALEALATSEMDLALIDLAMPGMDGFEVARRVRQDPRMNRVCLVALTGFGQNQARERSIAAGFNHHLVKPIAVADLQAVITRCHDRQDKADTE